jgi:hypothetical protein
MSEPSKLEITPPFGYGDILPLERQHRVKARTETVPDFGRHTNALPVSVSELVAAGRDFPIAFLTSDGGQSYAPIAILGFGEKQNLFVDAQGKWDSASYVPAYIRRYPFCIGRLYAEDRPGAERLVCVAKQDLDPHGLALYDEDERPTAYWRGTEQLLKDYEDDLQRTADTCASLAELGLFSPFQFKVHESDATALTLEGMYRIEETRLAALDPVQIKNLMTSAILSSVYAHFHSLANFARLYSRAIRAAQDANGPQTAGFSRPSASRE